MKHKIILIFILVPVILCSLFGPNIFYYLTEKQDYTISVSMDENETHILAVQTESKLESFSHQYRDGNGFLTEEIHFIGDDNKILPESGTNIKLFFTDNESVESHTITTMARELNVDFDIVQGRLENFRGRIMGCLVINVDDDVKEKVIKHLEEKHIEWEELD